jgi:hypothetical protein
MVYECVLPLLYIRIGIYESTLCLGEQGAEVAISRCECVVVAATRDTLEY